MQLIQFIRQKKKKNTFRAPLSFRLTICPRLSYKIKEKGTNQNQIKRKKKKSKIKQSYPSNYLNWRLNHIQLLQARLQLMRARTDSIPLTTSLRGLRNPPFRPVPPLPPRCRFQELPREDHGDGQPSEGSKRPRVLQSKGIEKTIEAIRVRVKVSTLWLKSRRTISETLRLRAWESRRTKEPIWLVTWSDIDPRVTTEILVRESKKTFEWERKKWERETEIERAFFLFLFFLPSTNWRDGEILFARHFTLDTLYTKLLF